VQSLPMPGRNDYNRSVSSTAPRRHYTYGEYLALDDASNVKLEFYAGDIFAMAGGTPEHAALCLQVASSLNVQLESKPCRVTDRIFAFACWLRAWRRIPMRAWCVARSNDL